MATYFTNIKERVLEIPENKGISKEKFFEKIGVSYGNFKGKAKEKALSSDTLATIVTSYPDINPQWLLTGEGSMLKTNRGSLIPVFEDVNTIGGANIVAEDSAVYATTNEYIDAGDWFPGATAAIRHYNTSMAEYPSGCLLALRYIEDVSDIVWGEHYVVEFGGNRVTKELQCSDDANYLVGYSTNMDLYPDGRLRHPPILILKSDVRRVFEVLGYVVKRHSTGVYYAEKRVKK